MTEKGNDDEEDSRTGWTKAGLIWFGLGWVGSGLVALWAHVGRWSRALGGFLGHNGRWSCALGGFLGRVGRWLRWLVAAWVTQAVGRASLGRSGFGWAKRCCRQ